MQDPAEGRARRRGHASPGHLAMASNVTVHRKPDQTKPTPRGHQNECLASVAGSAQDRDFLTGRPGLAPVISEGKGGKGTGTSVTLNNNHAGANAR